MCCSILLLLPTVCKEKISRDEAQLFWTDISLVRPQNSDAAFFSMCLSFSINSHFHHLVTALSQEFSHVTLCSVLTSAHYCYSPSRQIISYYNCLCLGCVSRVNVGCLQINTIHPYQISHLPLWITGV